MNEDGDFSDESANMMEEEFIDKLPDLIVEESGIKCSTEIALHSYTRAAFFNFLISLSNQNKVYNKIIFYFATLL